MDSSLKTTWFHSAAVQFPRTRHNFKRRHRWVDVKGRTRNGHHDTKCSLARHLRMVREDAGSLVKLLLVLGWRPMKQLAVRVRFLRCGSLLDDLTVEGVLSLVFM
ncbi:uncharacterized protein TNCV_4111661 [Trichonephila clavipes]|nr:uncharacterized protein TNCV_4111661 [Trichonephila clavipes]